MRNYEREDMQEFIEEHGENLSNMITADYLHQIEDMNQMLLKHLLRSFQFMT